MTTDNTSQMYIVLLKNYDNHPFSVNHNRKKVSFPSVTKMLDHHKEKHIIQAENVRYFAIMRKIIISLIITIKDNFHLSRV